jgi:hypothetical protein
MPWLDAASRSLRASAGPTVLTWTHTAAERIAGSISSATAATAVPSRSTVSTASASSTAAAAVPATKIRSDSAATFSARASVRFHKRTSKPSWPKREAMAAPSAPAPSTATYVMMILLVDGLRVHWLTLLPAVRS